MTSQSRSLRLVYVWEKPVRLFHWLNALSLIVLGVTGYIIGNPPALMNSSEASFSYWFGINRFIHFLAAYIFVAAWIIRLYWSFAGNAHARWSAIVMLKKEQWGEVFRVFMTDILQVKGYDTRHSAGHNALACASYLVLGLVSLFQVLSGFTLYAGMSASWFPGLFTWVMRFFESEESLRQWHHISMWFFAVFLIFHLYIINFHDQRERKGLFSSIFNGFKVLEKD
ncbi:MAG: Ni/Fe-hydrogenase, b-type cytochrome subunit [Deltaproteobacteria bacterium]|nr:Ni/Fe-hydrogenase, b-type cytochrome subunit [Deltaproteobacteria bacterium]